MLGAACSSRSGKTSSVLGCAVHCCPHIYGIGAKMFGGSKNPRNFSTDLSKMPFFLEWPSSVASVKGVCHRAKNQSPRPAPPVRPWTGPCDRPSLIPTSPVRPHF